MEGAVQIIDGVFLGGRAAFVNSSFLRANKVKLVINCAPHEAQSPLYNGECFAADLDVSNNLVHQYRAIARLLDSSLAQGETALIVSARGQSRCVGAFAAFLIHKFRWTVTKALTWLSSKYPRLRLSPSVTQQLLKIEEQTPAVSRTSTTVSEEEAVILNTYLNTLPSSVSQPASKPSSGQRIVWVDKPKLQPLTKLKSILKGSVLWKQQSLSKRLHRSDSGSTLDSSRSVDGDKPPGKAFFIGLAKTHLLSRVRRH